MSKKPAIILFTTISFVMILTILIMKMVTSNEEILLANDKEHIDTNVFLIVDDLKNAIGQKLLENKSNLDEFVSSSSDNTIKYNNIHVDFSLEKIYKPYNLNNIFQNKDIEDIKKFFSNNELDFEEFYFFLNEHFSTYNMKEITLENDRQIKDILYSFQEYNLQNDVNLLFNNFTYFTMEQSDKYYQCNLLITIDKYTYKSRFLYNLNNLNKNNIKVHSFEITIAS